MSVSGELLCSFELLKPLDSSALKNHIKKGRNKRNSILNSPVSRVAAQFRIEIFSNETTSPPMSPLKAFEEILDMNGITKTARGWLPWRSLTSTRHGTANWWNRDRAPQHL